MKELSIEEKAKRYDEAIEALGSLFAEQAIKHCDRVNIKDITNIFPEFKESGNIRIIKAIKYGLDHVFTNNTTVFEVTKEQCLAWLEKQGEHAKFCDSIQVGDKVTKNQDGVLVNLSQLKRVTKKDEKQGEQKPADEVEPRQEELTEFERAVKQVMEEAIECGDTHNLKADADMLLRLAQKPWSRKDEQILSGIIGYLCTHDSCELEGFDEWYDWLKSLKDRIRPQSQQEWSEEDEAILIEITRLLKNPALYEACPNLREESVDWLKSLRPQNTWKPSDDEMKALADALSLAKNCGEECAFDLRTLYEQLKKLKG